jgi:hypothetical protein
VRGSARVWQVYVLSCSRSSSWVHKVVPTQPIAELLVAHLNHVCLRSLVRSKLKLGTQGSAHSAERYAPHAIPLFISPTQFV